MRVSLFTVVGPSLRSLHSHYLYPWQLVSSSFINFETRIHSPDSQIYLRTAINSCVWFIFKTQAAGFRNSSPGPLLQFWQLFSSFVWLTNSLCTVYSNGIKRTKGKTGTGLGKWKQIEEIWGKLVNLANPVNPVNCVFWWSWWAGGFLMNLLFLVN